VEEFPTFPPRTLEYRSHESGAARRGNPMMDKKCLLLAKIVEQEWFSRKISSLAYYYTNHL
jgi:hypothetical protein